MNLVHSSSPLDSRRMKDKEIEDVPMDALQNSAIILGLSTAAIWYVVRAYSFNTHLVMMFLGGFFMVVALIGRIFAVTWAHMYLKNTETRRHSVVDMVNALIVQSFPILIAGMMILMVESGPLKDLPKPMIE